MASFVWQILGWGPSRVPPARDPTDEVLPCHTWDDSKMLRSFTVMWMFRFEDVLDPDMLHAALAELFEMDGWRRLGGRLRLRPDGKGEVHIPKKFTPERPAVYYTKAHHAMRMSDHPEAAKLPAAGSRPATFPNARQYASLSVGPGAPQCIEDFFYSDLPQYALHVVTFEDGTLVTVSHNHATSDMGGLSTIMSAWSLVLAGKKDSVPPLAGWDSDPMAAIYKAELTDGVPLERAHIEDKLLTGWRLAVFGIRFLWESTFANHESRILCIPRKVIDALMAQTRGQLPQSVDSETSEKPFVSENDVIVALMQQVYAMAHPAGSQRTIAILMAVDPRGRVGSALRPDTAYVQNAPCGAFVKCAAADAQTMTLGELASRCRSDVVAQTTEAQIKANANLVYRSLLASGTQPIVGDCTMEFTSMSNWSRGKLLEKTDFGPAVVTPGKGLTPGKPVYFQAQSIEPKNPLSMTVCIINGRDVNGDLWMSCDLKPHVWTLLMDHLGKIDESG